MQTYWREMFLYFIAQFNKLKVVGNKSKRNSLAKKSKCNAFAVAHNDHKYSIVWIENILFCSSKICSCSCNFGKSIRTHWDIRTIENDGHSKWPTKIEIYKNILSNKISIKIKKASNYVWCSVQCGPKVIFFC